MSNAAVTIKYKVEDVGGGFKAITADAESLRKVIGATVTEAEKFKSKFVEAAARATTFDALANSVNALNNAAKDLTAAYAVQKQVETQLETVMRQRMDASEAEIQSIKDLASAQQKLGIIGDEVQLAGAQQVATFLTQKSSIETLLPAMNNLLAQQKGFAATGSDAVNIANMMGKAMQGQTGVPTN